MNVVAEDLGQAALLVTSIATLVATIMNGRQTKRRADEIVQKQHEVATKIDGQQDLLLRVAKEEGRVEGVAAGQQRAADDAQFVEQGRAEERKSASQHIQIP